jgi:hypothetical protein
MGLEYEHLAGRVNGRAGPPAPPNGHPAGGDMPAAWARPWGSGPMVEIGTALVFYQDQRDRLAARLPARTVASAAADAGERRDRILSRFERAIGEWRPELERGRAAAADSRKREAAPPTAETAGQKRAWPWASPRFTRWAAAAGAVFVAVGAGAILAQTRGGESPVGAPSAGVASAPEPLATLGEQSREPQPSRDAGHGPAHGSRAHQRDNEAGQAAPAPQIPPPPREPAPEAPPAPVAPAAPVANPAPPPPPPNEPAPRPEPKPRPGPVSTLPPPGGGLPAPGGSGDGGG